MKKFFEMIKSKWLIKGTTTLILIAIVIACYTAMNLAVKLLKIEDIDFTEDKLYSLSGETKNKLKELNTDIKIELINITSTSYIGEYVYKYDRASDRIEVTIIEDFASRVDLQEKYNLGVEDSLIIIKNGDKEKTLTTDDLRTYDYSTYEQIDRTEEALTNAIVEVTIKEKPHIYVLSEHTYNNPGRSIGIIANKLIDEANEIDLLDILTTGKIPEDCKCLIMTTLREDISEFERDKILEYINDGGNILMLTSQNTINVETPNFNQVLAQYGIKIGYGIVLEQDSNQMLYNTPNMIIAGANGAFMSKIEMALKVFMVNPGRIEFAEGEEMEKLGVTYEPIASTTNKSFLRTKFNIQEMSRTEQDGEEKFSIIAAHMNKKISDEKTSQLIIYADETMASNTILPIGTRHQYVVDLLNNEDVILNSVSHLIERTDTITIRKTYEVENYVVTDQEDVIIKTIIFVVPVFIITLGIMVWFYRRRKR